MNEFNNPYVSSKISEALKELEIEVYENYQMSEWNDNRWSSGKVLKNVLFQRVKGSDKDEASPRHISINCCVRSLTH